MLAIAGVQLASLFFGSSNTYVRPVQRPETLAAQRELFPMVRARGDHARVYLSPRLWSMPGFSLKQGMLNGVGVSNDYEPLALARYAEYFGAVSPWRSPDGLFNGRYRLIGDTRWRLLDLTGTRFYVVHRRRGGGLPDAPTSRPARTAPASGSSRTARSRSSSGRRRCRAPGGCRRSARSRVRSAAIAALRSLRIRPAAPR